MSEIDVTEEQVRREHLKATDQRAHWLYFAGVLGGSSILMLLLIAFMDAATA